MEPRRLVEALETLQSMPLNVTLPGPAVVPHLELRADDGVNPGLRIGLPSLYGSTSWVPL